MNILIFDDSPTAVLDLQLKVESIMPPGAQIKKALNFESAHRIISQENIDLAFIDLTMPDKNGMDFIADIIIPHPIYSQIPLVIVTAVEPESILSNALNGLVHRYLMKPVNILDIEEILNQFAPSKSAALD
jgi:response regulator of citrate/malate metabolism